MYTYRCGWRIRRETVRDYVPNSLFVSMILMIRAAADQPDPLVSLHGCFYYLFIFLHRPTRSDQIGRGGEEVDGANNRRRQDSCSFAIYCAKKPHLRRLDGTTLGGKQTNPTTSKPNQRGRGGSLASGVGRGGGGGEGEVGWPRWRR